jgi:hypothetical protein
MQLSEVRDITPAQAIDVFVVASEHHGLPLRLLRASSDVLEDLLTKERGAPVP